MGFWILAVCGTIIILALGAVLWYDQNYSDFE